MPDRHGKYSYFDTPDGHDGVKKCWYVSKNMAKLGVYTGTLDAFLYTAAKTKAGIVFCYARNIGVLVSAGLAYVCGTYISTDLRKVDDENNHVVGCVAASAIMGAAFSNPWTFASLAIISTPLMYAVKTYRMNGVKVFDWDTEGSRLRRFPIIQWHALSLTRDDSIRKMYEEKNEEFYKQLDQKRACESSV